MRKILAISVVLAAMLCLACTDNVDVIGDSAFDNFSNRYRITRSVDNTGRTTLLITPVKSDRVLSNITSDENTVIITYDVN